MRHHHEAGMAHPLLPISIVLGVMTLGLGIFGIWAFINYEHQKNNNDTIIRAEVEQAKRQQKETDEADFLEREKQPTRQLVGPDDLGRVSFDYPKTWSLYIDKAGSSGEYQAYLHPIAVPNRDTKTPFALRVVVQSESYESILKSYQDRIEKGDLKATPVAVKGENGTRLDGNFSKEIQGSMVIFKVRDKTLRIYTESRLFQPDFDTIILKSLSFNK